MSNEENLPMLKKQRVVIKASCTRIKTYVDALSNINTSVVAQLEERKLRLNNYWSEYNSIQTRLEMQDDNEVDDRAGFEEAFYALSAKIRELLNPSRSSRGIAIPPGSPSNAFDTSDALTHVRLPKLNLPTFSGKYDEWFPFFDTFNSVIHANAALSNVQRFQYLRASLNGDASNVINSLEISDANYEVAWALLRRCYDNKRIIVQNHIKAIMELPNMIRENSIELRQIADGAVKHLHALQALKCPTSHWDDILIHVLSSKVDSLTLREWQSSLTGVELPTLKQFFDFITHRCQMLEVTNKPNAAVTKVVVSRSNAKRQASCAAIVKSKCVYCQGEHSIYYCKEFLALPVPRRIMEIRNRKLCTNCLRSSAHISSKCTSGNCKLCQAKHNTLLHASTPLTTANASSNASSDLSNQESKGVENLKSVNAQTILATHVSSSIDGNHVMLSTAVAYAYDSQGLRRPCRILLDCGSQANFLSRGFLAKLGLQPRPLNVAISGVNGTTATSSQAVHVKLQSRLGSYAVSIDCIVADQVTDKLPAFTVKRRDFDFPRNIKLADPQFHVSSEIDILIGADLFCKSHYWDLLCVGQIQPSDKHPKLQKTKLGWILAGRLAEPMQSSLKVHSFHAFVTNDQLHNQLNRFWQLDEPTGHSTAYTLDERHCEQHFLSNVYQTPQGRYVVKLPTKENLISKLGDSRTTALSRLKGLERRFTREPELKKQYTQFMEEYLALGHMKLIESQLDETSAIFYLPHHCVFKSTNQTSKIRVVFDASCKTNTGLSLNDALMVGPVVQHDLISILMRFRTWIYVFTADIIKMYRQVLVDPSQTSLQRILWRNESSNNIDTYELTTLTYSTASASYLATRSINHLADQYSNRYPIGSRHVKRDLCVDDLLTGADTIQEAMKLRNEITQLLRLGSFELSKWASNSSDLLKNIEDRDGESIVISSETDSSILGIKWNQFKDTFYFTYEPDSSYTVVSKRTILSEVARLFDPLGLLGPIIVVAKLIIQELWQSDVHWDESVPQNIHTRWLDFKSQLININQLQVPRCVKFNSDPQRIQFHGFCDASQHAYGACVYVRTSLGDDSYRSELLCSRSRVAPIKAVSLPRLELSAALLLARLIDKVGESANIPQAQTFLWSDSTITLNWIASSSRRWSVFVANRVGEIQRLTEIKNWRHIASSNNPADILSRGPNPRELAASSLWWHGPNFLQLNDEGWPSGNFTHVEDEMPEQKKVVATVAIVAPGVVTELLTKWSSLSKICRIVAYCLRFSKARRPSIPTDVISPAERSFALDVVCKAIQKQAFSEEYKTLSKGDHIGSTSRLLSLSPFMDKTELLRVGGRLENSGLHFDACHPILLPRNHELTRRIIKNGYTRNLHAGAQATMAAVRQRFWPLSLRSTTRKIIQECVTCFKAKPRQSEAIMGALPASRVTYSRPFSQCGVDYAGPLILREGKRRNAHNHKAYIAIFVCFATKAIHVELVSDLTSDAFIAAFKRFISRRGRPSRIYSDNGTTFVGAQKQIKEFYDFYASQQTQSEVKQFLCDQDISWNFIPPNAPHFGGLWEAAVKSAKYHMARIIGRAHLTFEETQTVLCEIEAILNSRPITPLSADPNDLQSLTPGHFLVGTALNSFPCGDLSDINEHRLVRWQRIEQIRQHFWHRWSNEYLSSLQEKSKWKRSTGTPLSPNQLVLIRQQGLAPLQWALGRVIDVHPGTDEVARVATVRTVKGTLVRPLTKLAILPMNS